MKSKIIYRLTQWFLGKGNSPFWKQKKLGKRNETKKQ